jgi:hypothetical protein
MESSYAFDLGDFRFEQSSSSPEEWLLLSGPKTSSLPFEDSWLLDRLPGRVCSAFIAAVGEVAFLEGMKRSPLIRTVVLLGRAVRVFFEVFVDVFVEVVAAGVGKDATFQSSSRRGVLVEVAVLDDGGRLDRDSEAKVSCRAPLETFPDFFLSAGSLRAGAGGVHRDCWFATARVRGEGVRGTRPSACRAEKLFWWDLTGV